MHDPVEPKFSPAESTTTPPIQRWHCDTYCRKIRHAHCPGEEGRDREAPDPCPFFEEMLY